MQEQSTNLISDRIRLDMETFLKVANNVCEVEIVEQDIESINRLGEKSSDAEKSRPLRVKFKASEPKKKLFKNLKGLRETELEELKKLSIDHDQTKTQREEYKKLAAEAKKREEDNPSSPFIYRVRGPPWKREIKEIKKRLD